MGTILGREPALILGALSALINVAIVLHFVVLTGDQVGTLNIALAAVIAVIVRQQVTPVSDPKLPIGTEVTTPSGASAVVSGAAPR